MGQRIEWVTDRGRFASLSERWEELAPSHRSPFGDHAWFAAWWDAFGTGGALGVCLLWDGDELCAALPLSSHGGRLTGLANYHTPLFSAPARDDAALQTVVDAAFDARPGELTMHAVRACDPLHDAVVSSSARHGRVLLVEPVHRSPRVDINGDLDAYMQARRSRLRNVRKKWRDVNREHDVRFRLESSVDDLDGDLRRAFEVEASGWKGRNGTAILCSPQTTAFYTSLAHAYYARGELRLAWLSIDGIPSAFIMAFLRNGRLYGIKAAFDERFRQYSPGLLVVLCAVERCFELGLEAYELLGAEEPWKEYFANAGSEHVRIRSYRRSPMPLARYLTRRHARPLALRIRNARRR